MKAPDLYLELDEGVINEAMAVAWQTGLTTCKGTLTFADKVPEKLKTFAEADWRLSLNGEPLINFCKPNQLFVRADMELELLILTLFPIKFDVAVSVACDILINTNAGTLRFNPVKVSLDSILIRDHAQVSDNFLGTMNHMISTAMLVMLKDRVETQTLPELSISLPIPGLPDLQENRLPIQGGDGIVFDEKRMGASIYLFGVTREDILNTTAISTAPIFLKCRQDALHRIYDFWWERMDRNKSYPFDGSMALNAKAFLEKGTNLLTRILTAGFLQRDIRMQDIKMDYSGIATILEKPSFELKPPNQAALVNLKIKVELDVQVTAFVDDTLYLDTSGPIPDFLTPWSDDVKLTKKKDTRTIIHLHELAEIDAARLSACLTITHEGAIAIKLLDADIKLNLGNKWYEALPENLLNGLIKLFNKKIADSLPPFVLVPTTLMKTLKIKGMTPVIQPEQLLFSDDFIEIGMGADIAEMTGKVKVPGYVVNSRSLKVHRIGCNSVGDIRQEHRLGYFVLYEALHDGYTSCKKCLKGAE